MYVGRYTYHCGHDTPRYAVYGLKRFSTAYVYRTISISMLRRDGACVQVWHRDRMLKQGRTKDVLW